MSDKPLHLMNVEELQHEKRLAEIRIANIDRKLDRAHASRKLDLEAALLEGVEYQQIIEARIARLERVGRNRKERPMPKVCVDQRGYFDCGVCGNESECDPFAEGSVICEYCGRSNQVVQVGYMVRDFNKVNKARAKARVADLK